MGGVLLWVVLLIILVANCFADFIPMSLQLPASLTTIVGVGGVLALFSMFLYYFGSKVVAHAMKNIVTEVKVKMAEYADSDPNATLLALTTEGDIYRRLKLAKAFKDSLSSEKEEEIKTQLIQTGLDAAARILHDAGNHKQLQEETKELMRLLFGGVTENEELVSSVNVGMNLKI